MSRDEDGGDLRREVAAQRSELDALMDDVRDLTDAVTSVADRLMPGMPVGGGFPLVWPPPWCWRELDDEAAALACGATWRSGSRGFAAATRSPSIFLRAGPDIRSWWKSSPRCERCGAPPTWIRPRIRAPHATSTTDGFLECWRAFGVGASTAPLSTASEPVASTASLRAR